MIGNPCRSTQLVDNRPWAVGSPGSLRSADRRRRAAPTLRFLSSETGRRGRPSCLPAGPSQPTVRASTILTQKGDPVEFAREPSPGGSGTLPVGSGTGGTSLPPHGAPADHRIPLPSQPGFYFFSAGLRNSSI